MAQRNSRWCFTDASVEMAMFNKSDEKEGRVAENR
jgi:hypothetical protein